MESMDRRGLAELDRQLETLLEQAPGRRRELHQRLGRAALAAIRGNTPRRTGRLASWQQLHIGSGGGYAAVRPQAGESGTKSPGAVTNYVENGHRVRQGRSGRSRMRTPYVPGRRMYAQSVDEVERLATQEARNMAEEIVEGLQ